SVLVIAVFGVILLNHNSDTLTERESYEQFISEKMKQVPQYSDEALTEMPGPTQPDMAAIQDYFMTLDPATGAVPRERLREAYQQIKDNQRYKSADWLQWQGTEANMGGRTRAIMWDPNDPDGKKVWAGGVTGGLWYRNDITDDNSHWQPVDDFWSNLNISCIKYDPNDPTTFYVGTGEAQTALIIYRESSGIGDGIWKSADGGQSWELLESTLDFEYVTDIEIRDEDGTSVIYAGVASGVYKGTIHQSIEDGLFRSEDGGATWDQVLPDIPGYGEPYAVSDIDIGADGRIYVGTMQNVDIEGGATILWSDNGWDWTVYDQYAEYIQNHWQYNVPGRVIVAAAPSNENVVYAAIAAGEDVDFVRYRGRYIIKSTNKGEDWDEIFKPDPEWSTLAWHAFLLEVDPNDPNTVFTGGLDLWKTTNSGQSWNHISDWALMYYGGGDEYVHADQHTMEFKPGSSDEFISCSDGGVFYTTTATNNYPIFKEKNQGYNTLQFYTCDIIPEPGGKIYCGGLQDNGTLLYQDQPLTINHMIHGGDGAYCFFDDELEMLMTSIYYNRYRVFLNWNYYDDLDYYSGVFINPADFDVQNNTLYANAVTFTGDHSNMILRITGIPYNSNGSFISLPTNTDTYFSHVSVSPHSDPGTATIFLGTVSGRVFRLDNAQANPEVTELTADEFPQAYVSSIAIGSNEDVMLVTLSNYGVESVWQTLDGGESWEQKEGNLPDIPVRWALYHPENDEQVMLATELGIWTTNYMSASNVNWEQDIQGMANVRVDMLSLREADNTVLAATHGRGFFTTEYPLDLSISVSEKHESDFSLYPNPATNMININLASAQQAVIRIIDITGKTVMEEQSENARISLSLGHLPKGNYVVSIESDGITTTEKLILK
ncbi:MAG: T9SS type A sorting domain-containing protein, partial [Bacteroidota bacterium]